jgi:histidinol phosphatase-like enzyme (inositol monophosphatase family)
MKSQDTSIAELEGFALELAHTAGNIAQAYFRSGFAIDNKSMGGFDPVTTADHAIERALRTTILERFPDHGIVAEEGGEHAPGSRYTWYIDPIDGTRAFMMGSPLWGTLVGLTRDGEPLFGLLCQPVLEEVFFGEPDGSWLIKPDRRERLKARRCARVADAALASTHPDLFSDAEFRAFHTLARSCLLYRYGGDCYNYAMLAAGFVDLVVEAGLKAYDIVPLIPILEGAGCVVTDWRGGRPMQGGGVVAAATPELHREALAILSA